MKLKLTGLYRLDDTIDLSRRFKSGVSLHCHTEHSREMLDFVPHIAARLPVISHFWKREQQKYREREGKEMDFSEAYWTPPLGARQVYDLEKAQINRLGLAALVSLTDHDDIAAGKKIRSEHASGSDGKAPISLEWTVPFEDGFFHLGVHNLPQERADQITKDLLDFTFAEKLGLTFKANHLAELLAGLNEIPEALIVFNHPLWDIEMVGAERHQILLDAFLAKHSGSIHAFEINGFRSWSENKAVLEMADALGLPVVSGGDRHGCQPNSVVNLSTAKTFGEFVEQIKVDKSSEVILMPHYHQPLKWRQLNSFAEILRFFPGFEAERQHWIGRVHVKIDERGLKPLSFFWKRGGPRWLKAATWTLGALGSPLARPVFELFAPRKDIVPKTMPPPLLPRPELPDQESASPQVLSNKI